MPSAGRWCRRTSAHFLRRSRRRKDRHRFQMPGRSPRSARRLGRKRRRNAPVLPSYRSIWCDPSLATKRSPPGPNVRPIGPSSPLPWAKMPSVCRCRRCTAAPGLSRSWLRPGHRRDRTPSLPAQSAHRLGRRRPRAPVVPSYRNTWELTELATKRSPPGPNVKLEMARTAHRLGRRRRGVAGGAVVPQHLIRFGTRDEQVGAGHGVDGEEENQSQAINVRIWMQFMCIILLYDLFSKLLCIR